MNEIVVYPNEINLLIFIIDQHIDHLTHVENDVYKTTFGLSIDDIRELMGKLILLKDDSTIL